MAETDVLRYYPIGLFNNAAYTDAVHLRGAMVFLVILAFLLFSSTFAHLVIAGIETAETAGNVANLLFSLSLLFCGVLVGPTAMPGFWIFMYRVSPFTYLVEALLAASVARAPVTCASNEYVHFNAPPETTCGQYLNQYIAAAGGYLEDPGANNCSFCQISSTDTYLADVSIYFSHVWRDFGILFAYIIFNILGALAIYWLARVPKKSKKEEAIVASSHPRDGTISEKEIAITQGQSEPNTEQNAIAEKELSSSPEIAQTVTPTTTKPEAPEAAQERPEPERMVTAPEIQVE